MLKPIKRENTPTEALFVSTMFGKQQKYPAFRQDNHWQKTYDENVEIIIQ
jgi:hypothetical protein